MQETALKQGSKKVFELALTVMQPTCFKMLMFILRAFPHQTDNKEQAATKADCCVASRHLCLGQKHCKTTAN